MMLLYIHDDHSWHRKKPAKLTYFFAAIEEPIAVKCFSKWVDKPYKFDAMK